MTYVVSGINGEKELFNDLLTQIDFRDRDEITRQLSRATPARSSA